MEPMKASEYDPERHMNFPVLLQPKIDGLRCIAMWKNSRFVLLSKSGNKYRLPHIAKNVKQWLPKGMILDCELTIPGHDSDAVLQAVRRKDPRVQLAVFDVVMKLQKRMPARERLALLAAIPQNEIVEPVPLRVAHSADDIEAAHRDYESLYFEGTIIRDPDAWYISGYTSAVQKLKSFKDREFEIVGWKTATGLHEGALIWICRTDDGEKFPVVPAGPLKFRRDLVKDAAQCVGGQLKVKYANLTRRGIPRAASGLGVRAECDL
jgi:ATP-dependent DNA ligase